MEEQRPQSFLMKSTAAPIGVIIFLFLVVGVGAFFAGRESAKKVVYPLPTVPIVINPTSPVYIEPTIPIQYHPEPTETNFVDEPIPPTHIPGATIPVTKKLRCNSDADCAMKNWGYCCGNQLEFAPGCFHKDFIPETPSCEGFGACPGLAVPSSCLCQNNVCEGIYEY